MHAPRKFLTACNCPPEIKFGSSFDWKIQNCKAHDEWLATPSTPPPPPYISPWSVLYASPVWLHGM